MKHSVLFRIGVLLSGGLLLSAQGFAQNPADKYKTEGRVKVELTAAYGLDPNEPIPSMERSWNIQVLTNIVGSGGYEGNWIDLNLNGTYEVGEGLYSGPNIQPKPKQNLKANMYLFPDVRMLKVVCSALTDIDLGDLNSLKTLGLQRNNYLTKVDLSKLEHLRYLYLSDNSLTDVRMSGESTPLEAVDLARNRLDANAMHRIVRSLFDRSKDPEMKPGSIQLGDNSGDDLNHIAKTSLEMLKKKKWVPEIYDNIRGVLVDPDADPDDPNSWVAEAPTGEGTENYDEWMKKHLVDDPTDLAIEEIEGDQPKAYPTVAKDQVTVEAAGIQNLEVYNISGELVHKASFEGSYRFGVQDLANGMYLIRVANRTLRIQVAH